MLVPLVPFFLAANISATESDWNHGAEVIYDAKIEGWTPTLNASGHSMIFNRTTKLHCQPDRSNSSFLRCKFGEASAAVTLLKPSGESQLVLSATDDSIDRSGLAERFDLYFPKDALHYQLAAGNDYLTKILVNQFNIAMNWTKAKGEYDVVEYSTHGSCNVKFGLPSTENQPDNAIESRNYKIVITPEAKDHSSDVISDIKIIREIPACFRRSLNDRGIQIRLKSSMSRVIITKSGFTSFTENEVFFRDIRNPNKVGTIGRQRISLSLDKIVAAKGSLPEIDSGRNIWKQAPVASLFYSRTVEFVFRKPRGLFESWLAAAGGKQAVR